MTSRLAQWDRRAELAKAEADGKALVSKQNRTRTLTSQVMQGGQIVASSTQVLSNAPAQPTLPRRTPVSAPATSSNTTTYNNDPTPPSLQPLGPGDSNPPPTDRPEFWEQFKLEKAQLAELLYHQHSDEGYGKACNSCCSGAITTVRCGDCWHRVPTCEDCFIAAHSRMPTHWAEVWTIERGFTTRCDISMLHSQPHIQLGHGGGPCPNSFPNNLRHEFLIVDTNGVHSTRLRFCTCQGSDTHVAQLMKASLFPATFVKPKTAFTFAVLKQFHIHHLESAESAYSFIAALRRSTDSFFFNDAADPYDQFHDVFKMWKILLAEKRYGHNHNIDAVLVDRPPGHLATGCPSCPEQNVNTDRSVSWPKEFRHLKQIQLTLDGNYHANHLIKHSDPNHESFFEGRAFFPPPELWKQVVDGIGLDIDEKPACAYLKAVSKQVTKKFIGCDLSGVVNIQCPHVFIISTVNLKRGEKFNITDLGVAQGLRWRYLPLLTAPDRPDIRLLQPAPPPDKHPIISAISNIPSPPEPAHSSTLSVASIPKSQATPSTIHLVPSPLEPARSSDPLPESARLRRPHTDDDVSTVVSYDIVCSWHVNVEDRMKEQYSDVYPFFKDCQYTIPLLHIQNHQDNCTYLYSSAFTTSGAHFHGETAEHPWVYVNQFGGQGRQMSHGNRHDLYADVFNNWNWKKYINLPAQLFNELTRAKRHRLSKRNIFFGLCKLYHDKIPAWDLMDRHSRNKDGKKEVMCVYRHNPSNIPSRAQVYEALATNEKAKSSTKTTVASLLDRSIELIHLRQKIKAKVAFQKKQIKGFRDLQLVLFPHLGIVIQGMAANQAVDAPVEAQALYTPSDFDLGNRMLLHLTEAGNMEHSLWEGALYDVLSQLRTYIRYVASLIAEKSSNASGQSLKTRAMVKIHDAEFLRDLDMAVYSAGRERMLKLGLSADDPRFPPMTVQSTFRKSTDSKPGLGSTYAPDGLAWTLSVGGDTKRLNFSPLINIQATSEQDQVATQSQQRPKRKINATPNDNAKKKTKLTTELDKPGSIQAEDPPPSTTSTPGVPHPSQTGWIWCIAPPQGITSQQIEDWMSEGDRVQWFRAEAEMMRWQEEYEQKLIEFVRAIRHYETMAAVWSSLSEASGNDKQAGKVAYARKTAARYREQASRCSSVFSLQAGCPDLTNEAKVLEYVILSRQELSALRAAAFTGICADEL
ncbi:hypothetical protein BKA70DRAFT_1498246 [Coprinopsis sp. MPI-PUGE-AT-0042]|nr:hypothetical protein BKA70DRAFT_1498246 [Coprinopsis sp. MPI-PUGE-AT-0042]